MPSKKPAAKRSSAKATVAKVQSKVESKVKKIENEFEREAQEIKKESKERWNRISARRHTSSTEEKIYMILWIILLVRGLVELSQFIRGLILIIFGLLFVTGFFVKKK